MHLYILLYTYVHTYRHTHLQDGEVLQHTVHHELLREVLQAVDEAHHVLTHGGAVDAVHKAASVKPSILSLQAIQGHKLILPTLPSLPPTHTENCHHSVPLYNVLKLAHQYSLFTYVHTQNCM